LAIFCFIIFTLLCYVRKIEIFASTHLFADIMIVLTLIAIMSYAGIKMGDTGNRLSTLPIFNKEDYASAIGFSVYCYEGIGIIMPV